jgi:MFS transporter, NNP family, nitrate/nitrite transporter
MRPGHAPTLFAAFLHFDLSFMLWVLIGALGATIAKDLHLQPAQKGLMVAIPILTGAIARVPLGLLADRHGARRVGILMLLGLFLPLLCGWQFGRSFGSMIVTGAMLGVAGASFSVALPLASRWYPPEKQGLVMGIAAAGNSGTVIANLAAPALALIVGWHGVFAFAMIPLAVVLVVFALISRESPERAAPNDYRAVLREPDLWWLCMFYAVTFGGYVGLTGFLPTYLVDRHAITPVQAGMITALCGCAGSLVRPIGGYISDRLGAMRVLSFVFPSVAILYAIAATQPSLGKAATGFVALAMCLGVGNGAVFQIVPLRFRNELGVVTGLVGALGGVGGFFLPTLLGTLRQLTGSFAPAFVTMAVVAAIAFASLRMLIGVRSEWRVGFRTEET